MPLPVAGIIYADNRVILSPIWDRDLVSIRAKKKPRPFGSTCLNRVYSLAIVPLKDQNLFLLLVQAGDSRGFLFIESASHLGNLLLKLHMTGKSTINDLWAYRGTTTSLGVNYYSETSETHSNLLGHIQCNW